MTFGEESFTHRCGTPVLPHNGMPVQFAGGAIPGNHGFTLIRDANCNWIADFAHNFIKCFDNGPPYFFGVVFNPTRFGEVLRELAVGRDYLLVINKHRSAPDTSGAGINSHDVRRMMHVYRFLRLFERCCDGPVVVRLVGAGRTLVGDD